MVLKSSANGKGGGAGLNVQNNGPALSIPLCCLIHSNPAGWQPKYSTFKIQQSSAEMDSIWNIKLIVLIDWLVGWLIGWLIGWLLDWLMIYIFPVGLALRREGQGWSPRSSTRW